MPDSSYPPQFADSVVSSMIGQINDFAGSDANMDVAAAPQVGIGQGAGAASANGGAIPVVITGTRSPSPTHFPGLRETMIGAAIYQLADQLPPDSRFREQIKGIATQLHRSGAQKILDGQIPSKGGGKKSRKK